MEDSTVSAKTSPFLLALALSWASLVHAGVASPVTSVVPCGIVLVGVNGQGVPDPAGAFTIIPKDIAGNPQCYRDITLDFSGCPDVSICSVQVTPGVTVTCDAAKRTITFGKGVTCTPITLIGGVAHRSLAASSGCVKVYADGMLLTDGQANQPMTLAALDESGGDGLGPSDLSLWLIDRFSGSYRARSDFNHAEGCVSQLDPADLAFWLSSYFAGYTRGCSSLGGALCP